MKLKDILSVLLLSLFVNTGFSQQKFITKDGQISFYSHTPVEDIKAKNSQVLAIIDSKTGDIVVSLLIKSFMFKKALMQEHFNENYMESDRYPKATFKGSIQDFEKIDELQKKITIEGDLTIRGVTKKVTFEGAFDKDENIKLRGEFYVKVATYNIKIPGIVSKNIAKEIKVNYDMLLKPYKK
ncbi:YceI family protein [Tenacibaculum maritimum]|uniref:YceI family protein n=1 Tax=Tenacibaculum maritimum TaxID=107401 RepID=UPI0038776268